MGHWFPLGREGFSLERECEGSLGSSLLSLDPTLRERCLQFSTESGVLQHPTAVGKGGPTAEKRPQEERSPQIAAFSW